MATYSKGPSHADRQGTKTESRGGLLISHSLTEHLLCSKHLWGAGSLGRLFANCIWTITPPTFGITPCTLQSELLDITLSGVNKEHFKRTYYVPDIVLDVLPVFLNFTEAIIHKVQMRFWVLRGVGWEGAGLSFTCPKLYCYWMRKAKPETRAPLSSFSGGGW